MDMHLFQPYVYDEAAVNRYFDMKGQDASRRLFAIMLGDKVIGELQLKQIDHDKKECSLSIHMQNDAVKGKVGFRFVGEDEAFKYYRIEQ